MYVPSELNLNNLPFSFHTSETQFSNGCFSFSNRNCPRITLLKIREILYLKIIALTIAIPFWHMFDLAFAALKNLSIARAKFEDHWTEIWTIECKCEPLNIKMSTVEYKCGSLNVKMSTVEYKCESLNIKMSTTAH